MLKISNKFFLQDKTKMSEQQLNVLVGIIYLRKYQNLKEFGFDYDITDKNKDSFYILTNSILFFFIKYKKNWILNEFKLIKT